MNDWITMRSWTSEFVSHRIILEAQALTVLGLRGFARGLNPRVVGAMARGLASYGQLGAAPLIAAARFGDDVALVDERGELTYRELEEKVNRLANALLGLKLGRQSRIGILCRNHRAPLILAFAVSRAGLSAVWMNTGFAAAQAREVAEREGVTLLVFDDEFDDVAATIKPSSGTIRCSLSGRDDFDALVESGKSCLPPRPARPGKLILLTSGTTGTPKGAPRTEPRSLTVPAALLQRVPIRPGGATVMWPPLFHGTGLVMSLISIALGSTLVLNRKFDPSSFLDAIEEHRATTACVVPVLLQRILNEGADELRSRDLTSLSVVFCSGSQLPARVAHNALEVLGNVVYNMYGSTEVSIATVATPKDLRQAPLSVGFPTLGTRVRILDSAGRSVAVEQRGRIFVGTLTPFEGYTGGGGKAAVDGLLETGDTGHFDTAGRLYIDGREDDMIVSGGENVFPREIEELLYTVPGIADVAVVGVDDADFGQRLRAYVVRDASAEPTADGIKEHVRENLARYKVPRDVVFVDSLPRNPMGKILKRELPVE